MKPTKTENWDDKYQIKVSALDVFYSDFDINMKLRQYSLTNRKSAILKITTSQLSQRAPGSNSFLVCLMRSYNTQEINQGGESDFFRAPEPGSRWVYRNPSHMFVGLFGLKSRALFILKLLVQSNASNLA